MATWRIKVITSVQMDRCIKVKEPLILSAWHGDELALLPMFKKYGLCTMTSTSKDGQLIDYLINRLGGATSKGSSTRGGVTGLRGLVRIVKKEKRPASLAVDGPKGPLHQVKPGVFELARLTKAQIVPVGAHSSSKHIFQKAWNKAFLPLPFSTVSIVFKEPWPAFTKEDDPKSIANAQKLASEIHAAKRQAIELIEGI